nr:MAG TPA: DNA directed RNA polymerase subunit [Caudoviricetes sp.]
MTPEELYSRNEPLVRWTIKKYYPDFMDDEDLMQEGRIGLWRACLAYDEKKGLKFSPVAVSYIRNALRHGYQKLYGRSLGKRRFLWSVQSLYEPIGRDDLLLQDIIPGNTDVGFLDISGALNRLSERDRKILYLSIAGFSQKEIAKRVGVSERTIYHALQIAKIIFRAYI